ncbi:unnamed protein product [Toxocara canis]|uniref:long-chain-fatty-acid--CoA ligase n=1 Tax=Toxocara canis TaxID=6265 RepID=A0A183V8X6_TOXCA|nr:unnamed protein product [Toxocara canis]
MWTYLPTTIVATAFGTLLYVASKWATYRKQLVSEGTLNRKRAIEQKDAPGVYRSGILLDTNQPVGRFDPEVGTLYDVFMKGLRLNPHGRCLGYRPAPKQPYRFLTYTEVFEQARDYGSALIARIGLKPGGETRVGIYGKNCPQWFISALACVQQSIAIVPLYDTLGPESVTYIIQQTEMR